jgi:hypothetical protein
LYFDLLAKYGKFPPLSWTTLAHFFHQNPVYESHWISFCRRVTKILKENKTLVVDFVGEALSGGEESI